MTETITGTVYKILFNNNETGYTVLKLETKNGLINATGNLPNIKSGQEMIIEGQWIIHPKFGKQFNIQTSTTAAPQNKAGLIKFLGSGLIKGIGESFAETIVAYLGMDAINIIETQPEKLECIPGIGPKRATSIQESLKENKAISNLMIFLQSKDIGTGLATKIYKHYKHESLAVIQQNPYKLIDDLWGVGFKTADSLALKIGIKPFAQERIKAGISYVITDALSQGNLYVEAENLKLRVLTILEIGEDNLEKIRQALQEMHSEGILKFITHENKHFLTLHKYLILEQKIAEFIKSRQSAREADINEIYEYLKKTNLCI